MYCVRQFLEALQSAFAVVAVKAAMRRLLHRQYIGHENIGAGKEPGVLLLELFLNLFDSSVEAFSEEFYPVEPDDMIER
jgi:hypothetical protein